MRYGKNSKNSAMYSRGALIILSMLSTPDIIKSKMNVLVQIGLGPRWKEDEYLARYTCIALSKLGKKENEHRLKSNHPIFQKLVEVVIDRSIPHNKWYGAAEQAISTIYLLNEHPDTCVQQIIKDYASTIFPFLSNSENQGKKIFLGKF